MPRATGSTINDATAGTIGGSTGSDFNDAFAGTINGTIGSSTGSDFNDAIVDAFIGPAKSGTRDGGGELVGIGDVGDERLGRRQRGDDGLRTLLVRSPHQHVVVAAQNLRHRAADSARRPGDQGDGPTARALCQGIRAHAYFTGFGAALPAWSIGVICRKSMLTCAGRVATKVITSATSWAVSDSTPW